MSSRDDDIEFDFFEDEPHTREVATPPRSRIPGRAPSGPGRTLGPPRGVAPILRLAALVVFAIFLVLVLALVVQSCASSSKEDAYADYMADVQTVAQQSTANGRRVVNVLTTAGLTAAQIQNRLNGIANQERQNLQAAQELDPPGELRDEHEHMLTSLGLRISGVSGLADTFRQTADSTEESDAALLVAQANRLIASDVVWADLFRALSTLQLEEEGISGVTVPESVFVQNPELVTEESMALVLQRIRGASTGGEPTGARGTNIVSTVATPGEQALNRDELTTVIASTDLAFEVTVEDSGETQEVGIEVTLTIDKPASEGGPIVKTETIDVINPGEQKVVTFTDLGQVPFARQTTVRVDVATVEGETNPDNNSVDYPVIFSLP
jgi:hypothetical protein